MSLVWKMSTECALHSMNIAIGEWLYTKCDNGNKSRNILFYWFNTQLVLSNDEEPPYFGCLFDWFEVIVVTVQLNDVSHKEFKAMNEKMYGKPTGNMGLTFMRQKNVKKNENKKAVKQVNSCRFEQSINHTIKTGDMDLSGFITLLRSCIIIKVLQWMVMVGSYTIFMLHNRRATADSSWQGEERVARCL